MPREDHADLLDALSAIPCSTTTYEEWYTCGMALKKCGFSVEDWKAWSATDTRIDKHGKPYYSARQCESKWRGFDNDRMDGVSSGTIVHLAEKNGWRQPSQRTYGWDDSVQASDEPYIPSYSARLIDERDLGGESFDRGEPSDAVREFTTWLRALFRHDEHVCVVTRTEDGRPRGRGRFEMTREEVEALIAKRGLEALGISDEDEGAFACINPLDGEGREDRNVTDYRYALVESDDIEPEKQLAIIHELKLPCAAITWSGSKSVHAVVHVDAADRKQYRERVAVLYDHMNKNGFGTDGQNKNESRLTRCPGFSRRGQWQRLIEDGTVTSEFLTWDEWQDWVVQQASQLPDIETYADMGELPPLAPTIIDGVLRRKQKMLVVGPSKAGKSFLMDELGVAVAEGWEWLGHKCTQGRVLLINFEIQRPSMMHRIHDVWEKMAESHDGGSRSYANLDVWNLRGHSAPLDKITPSIVRKAAGNGYDMIIIDPIYKVLTGDENSASDMAAFCNEFDKISEQLGCTVVYCHHHAKGDAGRRASMDRASGSGVFTRDPDAFLDMSPISVTKDKASALDYEDEQGYAMTANPFRVSYTLREFATPAPTDVLFKWPVHEVTHELSECRVVGEGRTQQDRGSEGGSVTGSQKTSQADEDWPRINELIQEAYDHCPRSVTFSVRWCYEWMRDNDENYVDDLNLTESKLENATKSCAGVPKNPRCDWLARGGAKRGELVRIRLAKEPGTDS